MAVFSVEINLVAIYSEEQKLSESDFVNMLEIEEDDKQIFLADHLDEIENSIYVNLFSADWGSFRPISGQLTEQALPHLLDAISTRLPQIADWVEERKLILKEISKKSSLILLIHIWIDSNSASLILPPELLTTCGQSGVEVRLETSDY